MSLHWPSSSARWCWGRLASWWRTRTEATPRTSTSCTGRTACSGACISSAAWRLWQSQCRPSDARQTKADCVCYYGNFHTVPQKEIKSKNTKAAGAPRELLPSILKISKDEATNWSSLIISQYLKDENSMNLTKFLWSGDEEKTNPTGFSLSDSQDRWFQVICLEMIFRSGSAWTLISNEESYLRCECDTRFQKLAPLQK